jgi:hypothetical protein
LNSVADNFRAGGLREFGKFREQFAHVRAVARFDFRADEKNPFGSRISGFDECFQYFCAGSTYLNSRRKATAQKLCFTFCDNYAFF